MFAVVGWAGVTHAALILVGFATPFAKAVLFTVVGWAGVAHAALVLVGFATPFASTVLLAVVDAFVIAFELRSR